MRLTDLNLRQLVQAIIKENNEINQNDNLDELSPVRFRFADIDDVVSFVDDVLMNTSITDISEKVAGQHLSVSIKDNFVYSQTKDSALSNSEMRNARHSRFGKELLRAIIEVSKTNKIDDQIWRFEMLHPLFNHDYIKYRNKEIVFVEYTGRLTDELADKIRSYMRNAKLLIRNDLKPRIIDTDELVRFRYDWKRTVRSKIMSLKRAPDYVKQRELGRLQSAVSKIMEKAFVSAIDSLSPVEGLVVKGTGKPFKISSQSFSKVQRVQLPVYSLFKLRREEAQALMENPTTSINDLRASTNLRFSSVYDYNSGFSLYETLKNYFEKASRLTDLDASNFDVWLTSDQISEYMNELTPENASEVYLKLYSFVKSRTN